MKSKQSISTYFLFVSIFGIILTSSCTQEDNFIKSYDDISYKNQYEQMHSFPTKSSFKNAEQCSRASQSEIPIITEADIQFLSSLSYEGFKSLKDSITSIIGNNSIIDSIKDSNYDHIYNILGGYDGIHSFEIFSNEYIKSPSGWDNVIKYLPFGLTEEEIKIYIAQSAYIDVVVRPIINIIENNPTSGSVLSRGIDCRDLLQRKLIMAGSEMGVETFIAVMTGGTIAPVEAIFMAAEYLDIWHEYNDCLNK